MLLVRSMYTSTRRLNENFENIKIKLTNYDTGKSAREILTFNSITQRNVVANVI